MDVKVFDGRTIDVGDRVAYPSHRYGEPAVMRKAKVTKIIRREETKGRVVTRVIVTLEKPERDTSWWTTRVLLRNLNTVVKL